MKNQILLKNINIFDVKDGTFKNNLDILIENDIIKNIGKIKETDFEKRIDCSGKFAVPGLFDCHTHIAFLTTMDDNKKKKMLKEFVEKGITQIRDVGGPLNVLKKLKEDISNGKLTGPEIFYAGPMLEKSPLDWEEDNKTLPGFTVAINTKKDARNIIQELSNEGASLVKTFNKFDVDVFKYLVGEAKEHNLPVTHDPGYPLFQHIPMDRAIDFGVKCFEHAKSPWPIVLKDNLQLEHNKIFGSKSEGKNFIAFADKIFSLGMASISLTKLQELIDKMVQNNVYFCPTLNIFKQSSEDIPENLSKEEQINQQETLKVLNKVSLFFTQEIIKQKVKILVGQDDCSSEFTFDEIRYLGECGLSESEIIKGATIYPSEWLGITEKFGSISANKKANILILNKNPLEDIKNIRTPYMVLQNGKVIFRESR